MKGKNKFNNKILKFLVGVTSQSSDYSKLKTENKDVSIAIKNNNSNEILQVNFENSYIFFTFFDIGIYETKSIKNFKDKHNISKYFTKYDEETEALGLNLLLKYYLEKTNEKQTTFQ